MELAGSAVEFRRAIELSPNYAPARQWYAGLLANLGQSDRAVAEARRARELDPLTPISSADVGTVLYLAHRYKEAIEQFRQTLELEPNFVPAHLHLGMAYVQQERYAEAIAEFQRASALSGGHPFAVSLLGYAFARSGRKAEAEKSLEALSRPPKPLLLATVCVGLGENERAIEWLDKAYEERSNFIETLKVEPIFDPLRSSPKFQDLLQRLGLRS